MDSNTFLPLLVLGVSCIFLGWRLRRGGDRLLTTLQSLLLVLPWLIYFGLFLVGIFLNLATLIGLLLLCSGLRAWLDRQIRQSQVPTSQVDQPPSCQAEDIKKMQDIFGIETFYATEIMPYQQGLVFKGNMRGESAQVYQHLAQSLSDRLGSRYELFLLMGQEGKPVVMILPAQQNLTTETEPQKILAVIVGMATVFTCFGLGAQLQNIDLSLHPEQFAAGVPVGLGIAAILGCREFALRWIGRKYGIKLGLPFFLPSSQIGTFGTFSRIQNPLANRQQLFDLGIAPALGGGLLSLILLTLGLLLSATADGTFQIPSSIFQASVLVGILAKLILGHALDFDLVNIHPLVVSGWVGLVITAINLMPAGQLDGGRIAQAIYGRRTAGVATFLTLVILAIATLINPLALYWGGIILILLRNQEGIMHNELTEIDGDRDALGVFALFWMVITLLPITATVAETLGIGG